MFRIKLSASLILITACLAQFNSQAEVYKSVNEDGSPSFSDKGSAAAKKVEIPEPMTYSTRDLPQARRTVKKPEQQTIIKYSKLKIASLTGEEAVRSNTGLVELSVEITPGPQPGHTIELTMDGEVNKTVAGSGVIALTNIDRGAHQFQLQVKAKDKIIQSGPVFTLNILRYAKPRPQPR